MKLRHQRKLTQRAMVGSRERAIRQARKKFAASLTRCLTFKPRQWYDLAQQPSGGEDSWNSLTLMSARD